MKILAIRGKNLNSLAGPFELDLEAAPLHGAGVFVITGPTGSGKSTLLDAMSLALFDRAPRLRGRGGTTSGELSANDSRLFLRHGAVEALAEVDFTGRHGTRWRATWKARRARKSGRYQRQDLALRNLDTDQAHGGTKTETLAAIEQALGLDYDAFCRSVLLAQNEFASFLRAKPDERAELLQRLTGTDLYARLSVAAHRRAQHSHQALHDLHVRREALAPLPADQRADLDLHLTERTTHRDALRARRDRLQAWSRWSTVERDLTRAWTEAEAAWTAARDALAHSDARRATLARTEQLQPLRSPMDARDRAEAHLLAVGDVRVQRTTEAEAARERQEDADRALATARAAFDAARARRDTVEPELERARALDQTLAELAARRTDLAAQCARQREGVEAARAEAARASAQVEQLAAPLREAQAWLEGHPDAVALRVAWPRLSDDVRAALADVDLKEDCSERDAQRAADAAREALEGAEREEGEARRAVEEGRDDTLDARRLAWTELKAVRSSALREREALDAARAQAKAARETEAAAADAYRRAQEEAPRVESALHEAERTARRTRSAVDLAVRRDELQAGEPCPLCGSSEHPYAEDLPPLAALLREQDERVEELRGRLDRTRDAETLHDAERHHARREAEAAEATAARAEEELTRGQRRWEESGLGGRVEGADGGAAWEAAWTQLETAWRAREEGERRLEEARGRTATARAAWESARAAWDAAQRRAAEVAAARARRARVQEALTREVSAGAAAAWAADPAGFAEGAEEGAREAERQEGERRRLQEALEEAERVLDAAQAKSSVLEVGCAEVETALREHDARQASVAAERGGCLEGRGVEEVAAEVRGEVESGERGVEEARSRREGVAAEVAAAEAREADARTQEAEARGAVDRARREVVLALEELGATDAEAREALARGAAWIEGEKQALEGLRTAAQAAEVEEGVRREALERHRGERPEAEEGTLGEVEEELEGVEREVVEAQAQVSSDDASRAKVEALGPEVERAVAEVERWGALGEVIGSADGKKFRMYAQSLTLDLLLQHANRNLAQLAPRYALRRVRGPGLALEVVDQDMADEVRPTSSLSGGETFLVSLSLALGLSALSGHATEVESLFIDEGLGSLDPETRELAVTTLDALQAGGRQVALVTHQGELAERIGVEVRVIPRAPGRSVLEVRGVGT